MTGHFTRRRLLSAAILANGLQLPGLGWAQAYPTKTIKFVMPFAAGGGSDVVARVVAEFLGKKLGQTVIVENLTGAGGVIGTNNVVHAAPDGYTLLFTPQSPITIAGSLEQKPPYDPDRDLLPLAMVATTPAVVVVNRSLKVSSLKELASLTAAAPGKYFYGSPGEAHEYQLTAALLLKATGGNMTHVPYRGVAPTVADLVAGHIQMAVAPIQSVRGFIADGQLTPLAVVGKDRLSGFGSNIPTTVEAGVQDVTVYGWFGVFAPAKVPAGVADRLRTALLAMPQDPTYQKKMVDLGFYPVTMGTEEFVKTIRDHRRQWKSVIQLAGTDSNTAQARSKETQ